MIRGGFNNSQSQLNDGSLHYLGPLTLMLYSCFQGVGRAWGHLLMNI